MQPGITIPANLQSATVASDGTVSVTLCELAGTSKLSALSALSALSGFTVLALGK